MPMQLKDDGDYRRAHNANMVIQSGMDVAPAAVGDALLQTYGQPALRAGLAKSAPVPPIARVGIGMAPPRRTDA